MKVRIQHTEYEGTGAMIMDQLRNAAFEDPTEMPDTESYIRFLQGNVVRATGLECPLPRRDTETRAVTLLKLLGKAGALEMLEAA